MRVNNPTERVYRRTLEFVERPFTTESKTQVKRGNHIVRQNCIDFINLLRTKHGCTCEFPLAEAKTIFQLKLDIWDRASLKAYFGQQPGKSVKRIHRRAVYRNTGTISPKDITLEQNIPERKGYLEILGLASYERRGSTWFLVLKNEFSVIPEIAKPPTSVNEPCSQFIDNFSLTPKHFSEQQENELKDSIETRKERESVIGCERNRLSESIRLTPREKLVLKACRERGEEP